jgi:hypothetical protein
MTPNEVSASFVSNILLKRVSCALRRATNRSGVRHFHAKGACVLRTRRTGNGQALFTLSGRIETAEDIEQLEQMLAVETSGQQLILDLKDVTLVNQDAVKFLRRCEADGIKLENCPLHVRRWIDQVKDRPKRRGA